ncbi:MAG: Formate--tetrahydrofolate ligase [Candidatus Ozemobacter sibiricus]|uniref:Formate--tetrahydrofolate ligase n=1 Tax=Candidatus Ozemobacter sibiricus TaxID=2268124 RepID=A0A367ZGP5_9BACT|nr:MAG: Formate--tetrahydrofolate ligase [Candidatus Ozemobacter sibiricus]
MAELMADLGLQADEVEAFGPLKAKVSLAALRRVESRPMGKLILVSAMTPTPAGEGKTTTTIGLADAFRKLGRKAIVCLREPSMGPVFGVKGGATGGGQARVIPADDINLHFTGDIHAVTSAHNLLAALVSNHIFHGNELRLDPRRRSFRRVLDMNERALRYVVAGLGGPTNGIPYETGFDITASSEVMAILCLSRSVSELKERLGNMLIGFNMDGEPVYARQFKAHGAMAALLKDAIKPNLVQTLCGTPAFIHGGPFANIAHGCNSLVATQLALHLGEIVCTEAGFGTDLGAEKFFDIKCRVGNLRPDAAVIVSTIRALKLHGGVALADLHQERMPELMAGFENLAKHIENIGLFGVPVVVAINRFAGDRDSEIAWVREAVARLGVPVEVSDVYARGPDGGLDLARRLEAVMATEPSRFSCLYPLEMPLHEKLNVVARCCYGASEVTLLKPASEGLALFEKLGYRKVPVCIAKTQSSLSDVPGVVGRPTGFKITVRQVRLSSGAGFVVAIAGEIMTMPGLPKNPSAEKIDVTEDGTIIGLS